jgi:RNA polymerase sigma-70 factor (ECF subfamily)
VNARAGVACLAQTWLTSRALWVTTAEIDPRVSDEALIEGALRGEPGAIQAIYERHAAAVYRRLTHLLGPDPDREDLLQEIFVDLFQQLGSYRAAASLRTYLLRIVANKACDHLRHRQRHRRAVVESPRVFAVGSETPGEPRSSAPSPEDRVSHAQELALVHQALDRLTPKKRVAFLLRVVEDLSLKEIAAQVGASVFTVAQRLRHANRELHRFLDRARRQTP